MNFRRTVEELERLAVKFWPSKLTDQELQASALPLLLQTQESFISILSVPVPGIEALFDVIRASILPANRFLSHLTILSDFGGEMLQRINREFHQLFPNGEMAYLWPMENGAEARIYRFQALPTNALTNDKLGISSRKIFDEQPLTSLHQDVISILTLGSLILDPSIANIFSKCEVGNYLGQPEKLNVYIRQRYLWVSRITKGAQSNQLGHLAQTYVQKYLEKHLGLIDINYQSDGHIPGIRHTEAADGRETTFDLVLSKGEKYLAVEISFQVTTNSVIERKSGQAQARYEQVSKNGYKIAYVLDGAGNFQRKSALRTICNYSDCTVAFSESELDVLCQFIRAYFG